MKKLINEIKLGIISILSFVGFIYLLDQLMMLMDNKPILWILLIVVDLILIFNACFNTNE
jgi:hypothetical protein